MFRLFDALTPIDLSTRSNSCTHSPTMVSATQMVTVSTCPTLMMSQILWWAASRDYGSVTITMAPCRLSCSNQPICRQKLSPSNPLSLRTRYMPARFLEFILHMKSLASARSGIRTRRLIYPSVHPLKHLPMSVATISTYRVFDSIHSVSPIRTCQVFNNL